MGKVFDMARINRAWKEYEDQTIAMIEAQSIYDTKTVTATDSCTISINTGDSGPTVGDIFHIRGGGSGNGIHMTGGNTATGVHIHAGRRSYAKLEKENAQLRQQVEELLDLLDMEG